MWHPLALGVTTVVVADGLGQLSVGISMCAVLAVTTLGVAALHFVWHAPLRSVGTESEKKALFTLEEWARRDSNPGPPPCHGGALTN